jgi:hypothetical protein
MRAPAQILAENGFWYGKGKFARPEAALVAAREVVETWPEGDGLGAPELIGEFVLPPPDGSTSRDFQTLHFDFGLPLVPPVAADVARLTALHVPVGRRDVAAFTRLVPLGVLLAQREWPPPAELVERFRAYGATHGARDDRGYIEGSLARIIEAAAGGVPTLPSVKTAPEFLCGLEFDTLQAEQAFLARHGLSVDAVEVALAPGELLVFDNLAVAHGRRGTRQPGELCQWVFGHRGLAARAQVLIRDRWLCVFAGSGHRGEWLAGDRRLTWPLFGVASQGATRTRRICRLCPIWMPRFHRGGCASLA